MSEGLLDKHTYFPIISRHTGEWYEHGHDMAIAHNLDIRTAIYVYFFSVYAHLVLIRMCNCCYSLVKESYFSKIIYKIISYVKGGQSTSILYKIFMVNNKFENFVSAVCEWTGTPIFCWRNVLNIILFPTSRYKIFILVLL